MMMMMMPLEFSCLPIITSEYLSMYLALIGWLGVTISILCAAKIHIFIGRRVLQKNVSLVKYLLHTKALTHVPEKMHHYKAVNYLLFI